MSTFSSERLRKLADSLGVGYVAMYLSDACDYASADFVVRPRASLTLVYSSGPVDAPSRLYCPELTEESINSLQHVRDNKLRAAFKVVNSQTALAVITDSIDFGAASFESALAEIVHLIGETIRRYELQSRQLLTELNDLALHSRNEHPSKMMQLLLDDVRTHLDLDGASFFVRNLADENRFGIVGSTPRADSEGITYQTKENRLTSQAWKHGSTMIVDYQVDGRETITGIHPVKFQDLPEDQESLTVLFVPVVVHDSVEGMLRCARGTDSAQRTCGHFSGSERKRAEIIAPLILSWYLAQRRHFRFEGRLSDISHEIGQGLSGVNNCVTYIREVLARTKTISNDYEIRHKLNHVLRITEDLGVLLPALDAPRLSESDLLHGIDSFAPYADLCRPAVERYKKQASARSLDFDLSGETQLGMIYASEGDFHHIIDNLIINAIKYTFRGQSIFVKLERTPNEEKHHRIHVMSQSIRIDDAESDLIFWSGYRTDKAKLVDSSGRGRGLAIAKAYAQKYDGDVVFHSADEYNIFTLLIAKHLFRPPNQKQY